MEKAEDVKFSSPFEKMQSIMENVLVLDWLMHEPTKDKMIVREYPINMSSILGGMEGDTLNMLTGIPYLVLKTGPQVTEVEPGDIIDMSKSFWLEEYNESKGTRPNMMKISIASSGGWVIMVNEGNTTAIKDRLDLDKYFDGKIYSTDKTTKTTIMQVGKYVFMTYLTSSKTFRLYEIPKEYANLKEWIKESKAKDLIEFISHVEKQNFIEVETAETLSGLHYRLSKAIEDNGTTYLY